MLVVLILTSSTICIIFLIAWKTLVHEPHTLSWTLSSLCAVGQWTCTLTSPLFPNYETYWLLVNALSLGLITFGLRGYCERSHALSLARGLWKYALAAYAVIAWTTLVTPHVGVTTAIGPLAAAAALFVAAGILVRHRSSSRPAELATSIAMFAFGVVQLIAGAITFLQGRSGDEMYRRLFEEFNFLTLPAGYIAVTMFTIFMLASDMAERMKKIAVTDQLTGLLNRRGFTEQAARAYASARRSERPVSVIMTDIDRFKDINDRHGHSVGDLALQHFAAILVDRRRTEDVVARMGGEEFALVLPGTNLADATILAEALCGRVAANSMLVDDAPMRMTASFGVSTISENDTCLTDVIVRADRALYRSKQLGRNRVDTELTPLPAASFKPVIAK
jgi:diguanylate cyclase (GGDEF)-like protein